MVDEPRDAESPHEAKLKAGWQTRKEKAIDAANSPGKSRSDHVHQNLKIHLMVGLLVIVTTIVLFVILFWDEWQLLDLLNPFSLGMLFA
ncbi:MAG: hypothetical protein ACPHF4_01100 [Rubripirellula sp.]|jgi:hypothetical protein